MDRLTTTLNPAPALAAFEAAEILAHGSEGVIACDKSQRVHYLNPVAERALGRPREALLNRPLLEIFPGLQSQLAALPGMQPGDQALELEQQDAASGRSFHHSLHPTSDGGLVMLFRDVTEPRGIADALNRSEEKYRDLFNAIDEGFCVIEVLMDDKGAGKDYRFLEVNPSFERQTGLIDAVGKCMREMVPTHEEHWFSTYAHVAATGESTRFENRAQGLNRWYDVYAFRVGKPEDRHVAVLFNDISQRKKVEEERQEADKRKDEFLAILAHELRNPLAPLRNGLEILKLAGNTGDGELLNRACTMMERQVSHMVSLVDDLLDANRISRGLITISRRRVDVADIIRHSVESAEHAIRQHEHELTVQLPSREVYVEADAVRLTQAVTNLLVNAAKYTEPGGRIALAVKRDDAAVSIAITDNGAGIPPHMLDRIFDLFAQVEVAPHQPSRGLGIGLTIVKQLVEMHGGTVTAQSEGVGKGSRFTITLPLSVERHASGDETMDLAPRASGLRRVLVADDNRDAAESLATMFELLGHRVAIAYDGEQAVTEAERLQPEVVLLDLGMPRLDGLGAARRIREFPWAKNAVLIATTGWGQEQDRLASRSAGFDHHLVKPVAMSELEKIIAEMPPPEAV